MEVRLLFKTDGIEQSFDFPKLEGFCKQRIQQLITNLTNQLAHTFSISYFDQGEQFQLQTEEDYQLALQTFQRQGTAHINVAADTAVQFPFIKPYQMQTSNNQPINIFRLNLQEGEYDQSIAKINQKYHNREAKRQNKRKADKKSAQNKVMHLKRKEIEPMGKSNSTNKQINENSINTQENKISSGPNSNQLKNDLHEHPPTVKEPISQQILDIESNKVDDSFQPEISEDDQSFEVLWKDSEQTAKQKKLEQTNKKSEQSSLINQQEISKLKQEMLQLKQRISKLQQREQENLNYLYARLQPDCFQQNNSPASSSPLCANCYSRLLPKEGRKLQKKKAKIEKEIKRAMGLKKIQGGYK